MTGDEIGKTIDRLEEMIGEAESGRIKFGEAWGLIKQIGAFFKGTHFGSAQEREQSWGRFQTLVQRVRATQQERQANWEGRSQTSIRHKNEILRCANEAEPPNESLTAVVEWLFAPVIPLARMAVEAIFPGSEDREVHSLLEHCSERLRHGWQLLSDYKDEMLGRDKKEAFEALQKAKESLDRAWERYREAQRAVRQARDQARQARQEVRRARSESQRERLEANIEKNKERLRRATSALEHNENHLTELYEKRDSARTDEYRARVERWIDETEDKIRNIREHVERIEGWLEQDRERLRNL